MSVVAKSQLTKLRATLTALHPVARRLIRMLDLAIAGDFSPTVTVTDWPDVTSVVIPYNRTDTPLEADRGYFVYANSQRAFEQNLKARDLDWSSNFLVDGIPLFAGETLIRETKSRGLRYEQDRAYVIKAAIETLPPADRYQVPENYRIDELNNQDVDDVVSAWSYSKRFPMEDVKDHVLAHVRDFPNAAVRTADGKLAGWGLVRHTGELSFIHVREEYRNSGLAKALFCKLSHIVIAKDPRGEAFADVVTDNAPMLALSEKCGYRILPGCETAWIYIKH